MSTTTTAIEGWLAAVIDSAEELATSALGRTAVAFDDPVRGLPSGMAGAYVALVGDDANIQFGLVAGPGVCESLARILLMLEEEDELSPDDTVDAVNELANILGGGVKKRMAASDPTLRLGLPLFVCGEIQASQHADVWSIGMRLDGLAVHLLVLRHSHDGR